LFQISIPQFRRGDFCNKIGTSATLRGDPAMSAFVQTCIAPTSHNDEAEPEPDCGLIQNISGLP
jgi:hypothetical protein